MGILSKLARWYFRLTHTIKTDGEVELFYKDVDNPWQLMMKMTKQGFQWRGELSWLDWNKTPGESLASTNKSINCGDFLEMYKHLYKKMNMESKTWLLEKNSRWSPWYSWHYVSTFDYVDKHWVQSDDKIRELGENEIMTLFPGQFDRISEI